MTTPGAHAAGSTGAPRPRIESLDQFRGCTVAAMFLVNFIGGFELVPAIFKHHHTYASYADTVMPQFFFAVGFAYRLVYLRRRRTDGARAAVSRALWRNTALVLLGLAVYHIDRVADDWTTFQERGFWTCVAASQWPRAIQALVHIGLTGFWVLPVIGARPAARIVFLAGSGAAFTLLSHCWYYDWLWARRVIDGGPFGFLTWTIPLLAGSLAHDALLARGARRAIAPLGAWGAGGMALGYALACLTALGPAEPGTPAAARILAAPPFVPPWHPPDIWTMSQRAGSVSYLTFSAGFSLVVYALFVYLCDVRGLGLGLFGTLGRNALAGYLVHDVVGGAAGAFVPGNAPLWYLAAAFGVYFALCWAFVAYLNRHGLFLRL